MQTHILHSAVVRFVGVAVEKFSAYKSSMRALHTFLITQVHFCVRSSNEVEVVSTSKHVHSSSNPIIALTSFLFSSSSTVLFLNRKLKRNFAQLITFTFTCFWPTHLQHGTDMVHFVHSSRLDAFVGVWRLARLFQCARARILHVTTRDVTTCCHRCYASHQPKLTHMFLQCPALCLFEPLINETNLSSSSGGAWLGDWCCGWCFSTDSSVNVLCIVHRNLWRLFDLQAVAIRETHKLCAHHTIDEHDKSAAVFV